MSKENKFVLANTAFYMVSSGPYCLSKYLFAGIQYTSAQVV